MLGLTSNLLQGLYKWAWEYYDDDEVKSYMDYSWDDEHRQWIPRFRREYIYTDTSDISLFYHWSADDQEWKVHGKTETVQGKYTNDYSYELSIAGWFCTQHEQYRYNASGDTLLGSLTVKRTWPDTVWQNWRRIVCAYEGMMKTDTVFLWVDADSSWVYSELKQYIYDDQGHCLLLKYYEWEENSSSWQVYFGCERSYNEAGMKTSFTAWGYTRQYTRKYEYDGKNRLTATELYDWDQGVEKPRQRTEYGYNESDDILYRFNYVWDTGQEAWRIVSKYWYYYGPVSGVEELLNTSWKVYPNPASDHLVIEPQGNVVAALRVAFYNLQGQLVKEVSMEHPALREVVSVGDLTPGYYLVRLYSYGKLITTRKVVIRR
jgi:hypothetical protein